MGGGLMKVEHANEATLLLHAIHKVLLKEWDPLGICSIRSMSDEYEDYLPRLFMMICENADESEVFEYLWRIENKIMEFIPNKNVALDEGAGTASVQFVASRNVKKIISGEFGLKIKPVLDSLKIQMIVLKNPEKKIKEIIEMLHR